MFPQKQSSTFPVMNCSLISITTEEEKATPSFNWLGLSLD